MSAEEAAADMMCCASCGTAEVDDIKKLKKCPDCDLVKYCSDNCQQEHLPQHEAICKKRAAELRDEILFSQPESTHDGDCPICFLPLPVAADFMLQSCCSKKICKGCVYANAMRIHEERLQHTCPFCRDPMPSVKEVERNLRKRVKAKDPAAILKMGEKLYEEGNYGSAFEYYSKAAELGAAHAHYILSFLYQEGQGVEKDEERQLYHLEEAAIAGNPFARHNLGCYEWRNKRIDRAVKHWIIAANLGYDKSIQALKKCYANGDVSKEDFAAALRAHQAAVDATKSPQREAAEKVNWEAAEKVNWEEMREYTDSRLKPM
jgi:hypothetical protein